MRTSHKLNPVRGSRAFTLAEMLIATGLASLVLGGCFLGFITLQRLHTACLTRSGLRVSVIRIFDSLEMDLRNATAVTAAASGNENILPLTITMPRRYTDFEGTGSLSGDPGRAADRLPASVNPTNGKIAIGNTITVQYEAVANGTSAQNIVRKVTWTNSGTDVTATRVVATVPVNTALRFRSAASTSATPARIAAADIALVARVAAPFTSRTSTNAAPTSMESTIFLRRKSLK